MEYQIHKCNYLPESGISIVCSDELTKDDQFIWQMLISHEANEDDLESNHLLENIGDLVWQTAVQIQCCPYCGEKLNRQLNKQEPLLHYHYYVC